MQHPLSSATLPTPKGAGNLTFSPRNEMEFLTKRQVPPAKAPELLRAELLRAELLGEALPCGPRRPRSAALGFHSREGGRTRLTSPPPIGTPSLTRGGGGGGQPAPTLAAELGRFLFGDMAAGRTLHASLRGARQSWKLLSPRKRLPLCPAAGHVTTGRLQFHFLESEIANSSEEPLPCRSPPGRPSGSLLSPSPASAPTSFAAAPPPPPSPALRSPSPREAARLRLRLGPGG